MDLAAARTSRFVRRLAFGSFCVFMLAIATSACSSKMEDKECSKIRGEAFDLVNKAQACNTDADCRQSDWPGCAKPVSLTTFEKVKPMAETFKKGQCEEKAQTCEPPPPAYCKQGLCAHKVKGVDESERSTVVQ